MPKELGPGLRIMIVLTILAGLLYPAVMTGVSQLVSQGRRTAGLVTVNGKSWARASSARFHPSPSTFIPGLLRRAAVRRHSQRRLQSGTHER